MQLAETIGGSKEGFADLMNKKAKELKLENTHFVTPHGLDNGDHYTTAYELALLTDYALQNDKFAKIVNTKTYTITINGSPKTINNTNELLGTLAGVDGVKTGFTNNAGRCLVTSTTRNNWQIITCVLGADTKKFRTKDSLNLIEYTFKNYELVNIKEMIENEFEKEVKIMKKNIEIEKGMTDDLSLKLDEIPYDVYPVKKDNIKDVRCNIDIINFIKAPVHKDDIVGNLQFYIGDKEIFNVDIISEVEIKKKDVLYYFSYLISNMGAILCNNTV